MACSLTSWVQANDHKIGICWLSAKHIALRRKSKESGLVDCCFSQLALKNSSSACWSSTIECSLFSPWYSWVIAHLALSNNFPIPQIQRIFYNFITNVNSQKERAIQNHISMGKISLFMHIKLITNQLIVEKFWSMNSQN